MNKSKKAIFGLCILVIGVAVVHYLYSNKISYPIIRSDGEGYYAYLPALFIYHDISLHSLVAGPLQGNAPGNTFIWDGTNRYLIIVPSGEAILMAPFFFLGWIAQSILGGGEGITGYSSFFQYAAAFSALFYTILGLLILWSVLERYFKQSTILIVLIGLLFGTDLFHYATYDSTFSHVYSFFLFSLFLFLVERVYRKGTLLNFVAFGIVGGLIIITRPSNGLWLLFGILFGISSIRDINERIKFLKLNWQKYLLSLLALVCVLSIQVAYWKVITGSFFVYTYGAEHFNWTKPEILNVLFSVRKGLFFWAPILLTVFPGLFFVRKLAKEYFIPILVFFPLNVYVISSWQTWWYGGSFGQRPFVESIPMFAIALCALIDGIKPAWGKRILILAIGLACLLSLWLMYKYWLRIIPFDHVTWNILVTTFFKVSKPLHK
ncbi:MAG: hypothetical protein WCE68_15770 [Anaerolineales bacterium]